MNVANVLDIDDITKMKTVKFNIAFESKIVLAFYLGQRYEIAFISDEGTFYFLRYNKFQNRMRLISKLKVKISWFRPIYHHGFKYKDCFVYA